MTQHRCEPRCTPAARIVLVLAGAFALLMPASASAQELEPGAYWPIPKTLNIVSAINSFNFGDVAFDPSAPIDEASARINTTAFVVHPRVQPGGTIGQRGSGATRRRRPRGRPLSR